MSKLPKVSCKDCYFNQEALCALQLDEPCPTFRLGAHGVLSPPRQAQLVPRGVEPAPPVHLVPHHQAA